jgi:transcriptional regulator with XRE-family HTH domain
MIELIMERQSERLILSEPQIARSQSRAARALLEWSQSDLAEAANVSRQTVVDFERGARTPYANNLAALRGALEAAGVEFIAENGGGAGVRLKERAEMSVRKGNLIVAINGKRLVRFAYDNGPERWFAPHALYRAHDGSKRVRGAIVADSLTTSRAASIPIGAADDDFALSLITKFDLPLNARIFVPAKGFSASDINQAATIDRIVQHPPVVGKE